MNRIQINQSGLKPTVAPGFSQEDLMKGEITYDALLAYLPLTEDKLKESNNKIAEALFANAQQFQNVLEDFNGSHQYL